MAFPVASAVAFSMRTFIYLFRFSFGLLGRPGEVSAPLLDLTSPPFCSFHYYQRISPVGARADLSVF
jgi:hypothetical protein